MSSLNINLTFLEPYRLVEFKDKKGGKELRGSSFARWKKSKYDEKWEAIITGTLLRSAALRAAEEILSIRQGNWEGETCCNGAFDTENKKNDTRRYRKRPTLKWADEREKRSEPCLTCPFCMLFNFRKDGTGDRKIHFSNLYLTGKYDFTSEDDIKKIATQRVLNRIDPRSGKAFDYFKVWEVEDNKDYWKYKGKIKIIDEKVEAHDIKLLEDSIKFIDRICGALCIIKVTRSSQESTGEKKVSHPPDSTENTGKSPEIPSPVKAIAVKAAEELSGIFKGKKKMDKLRTFADVVRSMRTKETKKVIELLEKKTERDRHIWDLEHNDKKVRNILHGAISENGLEKNWRGFCESLGQLLYDEYKKERGGILTPERILGDTKYYAEQAEAGAVSRIEGGRNVKEWIFTGKLKAETPFFFGIEPEGGDHTSIPILLDRKTRKYRIPRSVLRGILRRDLNLAAEGTGCNVEIGMKRPCICPVCMVMKGITIKDSKSDYSKPPAPDIRHRNRRNPQTATVDEGALFDIEVGPQGITFPFIMRYRGDRKKLPKELVNVLRIYEDNENGGAFLGGSGSTGKGRFSLGELKVYEWDLSQFETIDDKRKFVALESYIENKGLREKEEELSKFTYNWLTNITDDKDKFSFISEDFNPWTKVRYEITIKSPFLSADPIAALLDDRNSDSIFYKKRFWKGSDTDDELTFKGESIRGLFRTAFGRNLTDKDGSGLLKIEHEDCTCELCTLFGNEHEAGKIRFEDLEIENAIEKHMDHVSIDRFQGGAADQKKFDDHPLVANSGKIKLEGYFWIRSDLLHETKDNIKEKLRSAICDIRDGLYPLGGKGGIGYGWVEKFKVTEPNILKIPNDRSVVDAENRTISSEPLHGNLDSIKLGLRKEKVYCPHYFLKPDEVVKVMREPKLIGHEKFHDNHYTGEIKCTLTTETPLIISDTGNNDAFGMQEDYEKHKNFRFFRIDDKEVISGSGIRGPIGSVYEALTNSCFRVFEEKRYLSRRISPDDEEEDKRIMEQFVPGRVKIENNEVHIVRINEEFRLPLYDDSQHTQNIKDVDYKVHKDEKRNNSIKKANMKIAETAEKNQTYLNSLNSGVRKDILSGKKEISFSVEKASKYDKVATLGKGEHMGYIKFSGLNMVNVENATGEPDKDFDSKWDIWSLNILLNTEPDNNDKRLRKSRDHKYPRPFLQFIKDEKKYFIPKRCERVFLSPDEKAKSYCVPLEVQNQYKDILRDYENNFGHINEKFKTLMQNSELKDENLVYFIPNEKEETVSAIIPVRISRKTDNYPLGKRFFNDEEHSYNLRPCEREILEDIDTGKLVAFSEKYLLRRHEEGLCPSCRLFGTTSYKSRVRFGFAEIQNTPQWLMGEDKGRGKPLTLPLLEKPRPTWSMPKNKSKVPGRKFYVHHNGWKTVKKDYENGADYLKPTENNRTVEPLDKDNRFNFNIFFENLKDWELGLLLYSLTLENKMAHKIGMGKALGFGSVKIKAERVVRRKSAGNWEDESDNGDYFIDAGLEWLKSQYGGDLNKIDHLQKLRRLLTVPENIDVEVEYPKLRKKDDSNKRDGKRLRI